MPDDLDSRRQPLQSRDRYPEPPCGNLPPLGLVGRRWLSDSHNCRSVMNRRTCGRMPSVTQSVRQELFGQQNARTVISTGEKVAQGAAKKKKIIEDLFGGQKLALDMSLRRTGRGERKALSRKRRGARARPQAAWGALFEGLGGALNRKGIGVDLCDGGRFTGSRRGADIWI